MTSPKLKREKKIIIQHKIFSFLKLKCFNGIFRGFIIINGLAKKYNMIIKNIFENKFKSSYILPEVFLKRSIARKNDNA